MIRFATGVDKYKAVRCYHELHQWRTKLGTINVREPAPCSRIATKDGLEYLEYFAVLQVPFI